MLITFARHSNNAIRGRAVSPSDFLPLTDYMDGPSVSKRVAGKWIEVARSPVPEVLVGNGPTLRRQIAMLSYERKYSSCVLSFAPSDIDVTAFNAGDARLRREIDLTLELFFETAWPGIAGAARPHAYVTTHTHTGRLEVNIAIPRMVFDTHGRHLSFNPNPPVSSGEKPEYLGALQDLANASFGWADPSDPERTLLFKLPDWHQKQSAEGQRSLLADVVAADIDYPALQRVILDMFHAGEITDRPRLVAALNHHLRHHGQQVLSMGRKTVSIGKPGTAIGKQVTLRGRLFDQDLSREMLSRWEDQLPVLKMERASQLAMAGPRMAENWRRRVEYYSSEIGSRIARFTSDWSVELWQERERGAAPRLIPRRHHAHFLQRLAPTTETMDHAPREVDTHSTPDTRPDRAALRGTEAGNRGPATADRGPRPADHGPGGGIADPSEGPGCDRDGYHAFDRELDVLELNVEWFASPRGFKAVVRALARLTARLAISFRVLRNDKIIAGSISDEILRGFRLVLQQLEVSNDFPGRQHGTDHQTQRHYGGTAGMGSRSARRVDRWGPGGDETSEGDDRAARRDHRWPEQDRELPARVQRETGSGGGGQGFATGPASPVDGSVEGLGRTSRQMGGDVRKPRTADRRTDTSAALTAPGRGSIAARLVASRQLARSIGADRVTVRVVVDVVVFRAPMISLDFYRTHINVLSWTGSRSDLTKVKRTLAASLGFEQDMIIDEPAVLVGPDAHARGHFEAPINHDPPDPAADIDAAPSGEHDPDENGPEEDNDDPALGF